MSKLFIVDHAFKHGLSEGDIEHAWDCFVAKQRRHCPHEDEIVVVGPRLNGNMVQVVATERAFGIVVYHAMEPVAKSVLEELGLSRRG